MEQLCKRFRDRYEICAITNDIYTKEDARILTRGRRAARGAHHGRRDRRLPAHRDPRGRLDQPRGHRRDATGAFPKLDLILIESGGDNLAATFSPELADLTLYVIDVAGGEKIPRKGGPGITRSDLLVINKTDLAPLVGADLGGDGGRHASACAARGPTCSPPCATGAGADAVARFVDEAGGLG